ncbi:MAG: hypothetical protein QM535_07670 [Limnohabitans sp.]|nr:hypothetical protein [Limnohabitans sp.]
MERFTTNNDKYFEQIKKELTEIPLPKSQSLIFTYCEIGQLLSYGFSVSLIKDEKHFLKIKRWNAAFDNQRFNLKIFNLDRLAVAEKNVELTNAELFRIEKLIEDKLELKKNQAVVLDGLFCQFKTKDCCLNWNTDEEMATALFKVVTFLRNIRCQNE